MAGTLLLLIQAQIKKCHGNVQAGTSGRWPFPTELEQMEVAVLCVRVGRSCQVLMTWHHFTLNSPLRQMAGIQEINYVLQIKKCHGNVQAGTCGKQLLTVDSKVPTVPFAQDKE